MNQEEMINSNLSDKEKYIQEKYFLSLRLERLKQNRDKEIEEYMSKWVSNRPDFGALIRRDLEKSYEKKEKELEEKIKELDIKINKNNNEPHKLSRNEIENKIIKLTNSHQEIIKKLTHFDYIYDENKNIVNFQEYKELFDEASKVINEKYDLNNLLNNISEYEEKIEIIEKSNTQNILLDKIYQDIMEQVKILNIVRIKDNKVDVLDNKENYEPTPVNKKIKLPNGIYIDINDINNALKKYENEEKGKTYKVNLIDSNNQVYDSLLNEIKQNLIEVSIIKLLSEKKLGFFDIKRVYGNEKTLEFENKVKNGGIKSSMINGNYINLEEFSDTLKEIISIKGQSWIEENIEKEVIK